jgi:hypothetical protein
MKTRPMPDSRNGARPAVDVCRAPQPGFQALWDLTPSQFRSCRQETGIDCLHNLRNPRGSPAPPTLGGAVNPKATRRI